MSGLVLANWRIVLLGVTSVVLSVASGWTTLDGMSNFTSAPMLSFLITFGIQSVMLISAWMLGQEIVNRFHDQNEQRQAVQIALWLAAAALAAFLLSAPYLLPLLGFNSLVGVVAPLTAPALVVSALLVLFALLLGMRHSPNPPRAMLNTAMLVAMFTTCMLISVFFSFDSLFSKVFPDSERARASEIRAQSQTDTILTDLFAVARREQTTERSRLIDGPAWREFASDLDRLQLQLSERVTTLEADRSELTQQQNLSMQAQARERAEKEAIRDRAKQKHAALQSDLERLKQQRGETQAAQEKVAKLVQESLQRLREAEARAQEEEQGIGSTGRAGRGPVYDSLMADVARVKIEIQGEESEQEQLITLASVLDSRIEAIEQAIVAQAVALKVADTALSMQDITGQAGAFDKNQQLIAEIKAQLLGVKAARGEFENAMSQKALEQLGRSCRDSTGLIKRSGGETRITCSTADLDLASAKIDAITKGIAAISQKCSAIEPNSTQTTSPVESFVPHARDCLQLAGLSSSATESLRRSLDNIERNRDDRAHRFIVTMNAFTDGNRLAYLALAIALGIDGLVFISGLLAAASSASPFRSLPGAAGHTVAGADRIMRSALLPNSSEVAGLTLAAILPVRLGSRTNTSGFTHQIDLRDDRIRRSPEVIHLINAAAGIDAARRDECIPDLYLLRREMIDFLSLHMADIDQNQQLDRTTHKFKELIHSMLGREETVTLEAFLRYVRPADDSGDFNYIINLDDCPENDKTDVIRILNVCAINAGARSVKGEENRFVIHRDLLAMILDITRTEDLHSSHSATANSQASEIASVEELTATASDETKPAANNNRDHSDSNLVSSNEPPTFTSTNSTQHTDRTSTAIDGISHHDQTVSDQGHPSSPDRLVASVSKAIEKSLGDIAMFGQNAQAAAPDATPARETDSMIAQHQVHPAVAPKNSPSSKARPKLTRKIEHANKPFNVKIVGDSMKFD